MKFKNFVRNLWQHTFFYRTYDVISSGIDFFKARNIVGESFHSKEFAAVLKQYLRVSEIKTDWLGRLYTVINPNIINNTYDFSNVIIEIDGDNTNNNEYVKAYVYKQLELIAYLFKLKGMYDYISVDFKHVGPNNADNYLIVFDITTRQDYANAMKKFLLHLTILLILTVVLIVCLI